MKMMNKMIVLISFIVISFILYCVTFHDAGAGLKVVKEPGVEIIQRAPAELKIQFAIVDNNIQEWHEELCVIDSVVTIPEYMKKHEVRQQKKVMQIDDSIVNIIEEEEDNHVDVNIVDVIDNNDSNDVQYASAETEIIEADMFYIEEEEVVPYEEEIVEVTIEEKDEQFIVEPTIDENEESADAAVSTGSLGESIVNYAREWVGVTPYVSYENREYSSLEEGTDCSGFVSLVYGEFGIQASSASDDYQTMSNTTYEDLQVGDVIVYRNGEHVGIYAGDDTVIHCSNPVDGTIQSDMWYSEPTGYVHLYDEQSY